MRRRIEKSVRQCRWAPAERTLTILAYLAPPVKRQNAAVRVQESDARRTHVGRSRAPTGRSIPAQGNALGIKEQSQPQALKGRAN